MRYPPTPTIELSPWRSAGCGEHCECRLVEYPQANGSRYAIQYRGPLIAPGLSHISEILTRRDGIETEEDARMAFAHERCRHP